MRYTILTEETQEHITGHFATVMQRMWRLNDQGVCYLVYDQRGYLRKPQWLLDDWHRCRQLDAMATHDAQGA